MVDSVNASRSRCTASTAHWQNTPVMTFRSGSRCRALFWGSRLHKKGAAEAGETGKDQPVPRASWASVGLTHCRLKLPPPSTLPLSYSSTTCRLFQPLAGLELADAALFSPCRRAPSRNPASASYLSITSLRLCPEPEECEMTPRDKATERTPRHSLGSLQKL